MYYVHNYHTLEKVQKCLRGLKVNYKAVRRTNLTPQTCKDADLIIVVGGDGTFLKTTRHVFDDTPVLPVSSDTKYNEAFYSKATPQDFAKKFEKLINGKSTTVKLPRLEAKINGKTAKALAVNEVFVGSAHPYQTSRYVLKVKRKEEFQKSSGVLITTRSGRTGWAMSAAKKRLNVPKNGLGYVVREPYSGRLTKPKLLQGVLTPQNKIKIKSSMHRGIVVIDSSSKELKFTDGSKLEVTISKKTLTLVAF